MRILSIIIKAFFQTILLGVGGFVLGKLFGFPIIGIAFTFGFVLLWYTISGQLLLTRLRNNESGSLPLTLSNQAVVELSANVNKKLAKSIKENKRLLGVLDESAEAIPLGIVVVDKENRILWINSKAEEFLGIQGSDEIGERIEKLIHQLHFVNEELNKDSLNKSDFIEIDGPQNNNLRLRLSITTFSKRYRMIAVQDLSQFHRVDKMRQDFIGNASHELRTPLTVIRGYLEEMLEDETIPELWNDPMQVMDKQVSRMQNIIEDMLTLSNLESRMSLAAMSNVNLMALLKQVKSDLSAVFHDSHKVKLEIQEGWILKGEESELYSVFSNLLKNAFIYSPSGSSVKISLETTVNNFKVIVSDNGPGIPKESLQRLTERFYRIDSGRAREQGGTGLGLAIVKHALMRHEAHLIVESELGEGSRFICHFPKQRVVSELSKNIQ